MRSSVRAAAAALLAAAILASPSAQTRITTPREQLGFNFGDDYQLANYTQIADYWRKLDAQSDRMILQEIGKTAEGRPQLMAIVTSPANHKNLAKYRDISRRLAFADGVDRRRGARARRGKGRRSSGSTAACTRPKRSARSNSPRWSTRWSAGPTPRRCGSSTSASSSSSTPIPDGNDLVADWYMRNPDPLKRSAAGLPRLYQKYIGHDNNRDFFASTQPETENINRVLYHEWLPQILYNHHQSGPAGTVVWSSPQRDPYNYNLDPLLILGLQALGTHMHQRLAAEGKPGATMASGGAYDGWWNGGIRNTGNFHNIIAILTETIGSPTPMRIPLVIERQIPNRDLPYPIAPQEWRFKQSIDYSISFNRAVIDYAARNREHLLFNIYAMGQRAIERGSQDYVDAVADAAARWSPKRWAAAARRHAASATRRALGRAAEAGAPRSARRTSFRRTSPTSSTAIKFINALREVNVTVHRATARRSPSRGKTYPAGSFVVMTAQAFRPHVLDMFEPQDHPNVIPYPGAPPTRAVRQRRMDARVSDGRAVRPRARAVLGTVRARHRLERRAAARPRDDGRSGGWRVSDRPQGERRVSRGEPPARPGRARHRRRRMRSSSAPRPRPPRSCRRSRPISASTPRGSRASTPAAQAVRTPRIGLWDQYGGSMESGWTRWILEQFEFPFDARLRAAARRRQSERDVRRADLPERRDSGGPRRRTRRARRRTRRRRQNRSRRSRGVPVAGRTRDRRDARIPQLRQFIEAGGTVIAIGDSAMNLAAALKLPVEDHLVENGAPLPRAKYFVPGSVLAGKVDITQPIAAGMSARTDFFFDNSPVFKLGPGAAAAGVRAIATFDSPAPLRSGWAWGQTVSRRRRHRHRGDRRQGTRAALRPRDPAARAAARHVQAAVQRHLRERRKVEHSRQSSRPTFTESLARPDGPYLCDSFWSHPMRTVRVLVAVSRPRRHRDGERDHRRCSAAAGRARLDSREQSPRPGAARRARARRAGECRAVRRHGPRRRSDRASARTPANAAARRRPRRSRH